MLPRAQDSVQKWSLKLYTLPFLRPTAPDELFRFEAYLLLLVWTCLLSWRPIRKSSGVWIAILLVGRGVLWCLICAVIWPDCRPFGHAINTFFSSTTRNGSFTTQFWEQCPTISVQVILLILTLFLFPHSLHTLQFRLHFSLSISVINLLHTYVWDIHRALPPSDIQEEAARWILLFKEVADSLERVQSADLKGKMEEWEFA